MHCIQFAHTNNYYAVDKHGARVWMFIISMSEFRVFFFNTVNFSGPEKMVSCDCRFGIFFINFLFFER